jgi:nucleoside-diphosphate-sugar epimerase
MNNRYAMVTGCAGFLGSHLCEALVASGHAVRGVDCFTDFYARDLKLPGPSRRARPRRSSRGSHRQTRGTRAAGPRGAR